MWSIVVKIVYPSGSIVNRGNFECLNKIYFASNLAYSNMKHGCQNCVYLQVVLSNTETSNTNKWNVLSTIAHVVFSFHFVFEFHLSNMKHCCQNRVSLPGSVVNRSLRNITVCSNSAIQQCYSRYLTTFCAK